MNELRAELAIAASSLDGVNVTTHYRQSLKPGDGFVKWNGRTRDDSGLGWIDSWQLWIAIPQDVKKAEEWLADTLALLIDTVDDFLVVTGAVPADLVLGNTSTNGLIIEGTRPAA